MKKSLQKERNMAMQKSQLMAVIVTAMFLIIGGMSVTCAQQSMATNPQQSGGTTIQPNNIASADKSFTDSALQSGMLEVALAKEAASKAVNPDVKAFANSLVQDHTKLDEQLTQIAQKQGLQAPDAMGAGNESRLHKISKFSGSKFDRAYISYVVSDHQSDIRAFENEAKDGSNQSLKTFALQMEPHLRVHLSKAETIDGRLSHTSNYPWWEFWKKV